MKKNTRITYIVISALVILASLGVILFSLFLKPSDNPSPSSEITTKEDKNIALDEKTLSSFASFLSLTSTTHDSFVASELSKDQMYELLAYYLFWGDFRQTENPFIDIKSCQTPLKDQIPLMKELEEMNIEPDTVSDYTYSVENFNKIAKAFFGDNAPLFEKEYFNVDLYVNTNTFAKLLYSKNEDALIFEYAATGGMMIPCCYIDKAYEKDDKMYIDYTILYYDGYAEGEDKLSLELYSQVEDFKSKQEYLKSVIDNNKNNHFTTLSSSIVIDKKNGYKIDSYTKKNVNYSEGN